MQRSFSQDSEAIGVPASSIRRVACLRFGAWLLVCCRVPLQGAAAGCRRRVPLEGACENGVCALELGC